METVIVDYRSLCRNHPSSDRDWKQVGKRISIPPDPEPIRMWMWFNNAPYHANIPALRKLHPYLKTLKAWARQTGWEHAEPQPQDAAYPPR